MIKVAVILAAGLGSRIKEFSSKMPKGFIEINGISLIERSIKILINEGISKIFIGTGYKSHFYDKLKAKYSCVTTFKNYKFSSTGSFHTLFVLKTLIKEDFLLLESDLLYEKFAITSLMNEKRKDVIISSDFTNSGDEVFVIEENKRLIKLSKFPKDSELPESEFVGISKVSIELYKEMCSAYNLFDSKKIEYEELFNICSSKNDIYIKNLKQIAWCEIDNQEHYKKAINIISPKILNNETK